MKAAGKSSNDKTGASGAESEDIAKLLRALNEDLKPDPADDDIAELEDEVEPKAERRLPLGKIAAALIAAAGIGFAVVMLDQESGAPSAPPAPAVAPLITAAPAPGGSSSGASAPASAAKPEPLIARAPAPGATPPAPPPPAPAPAVAPPPPSAVAAPPSPPPALKVPEPPPPAQTVTQTITAPKPATPEPVAKLPEPPPPSLAVKAPDPVKTEPAKIAAAPEAPKAAPAPVKAPEPFKAEPAKPAEPVKAAGAEATDLQAMLSPKAAKRAKAEAKTQTASLDESAVESTAPTTTPGGRYAVQLGSFHVAENAEALVRKLQGSGYRAYALDWTDASQQSWRVVRVGGFGDTAAAKRAAGELKAKVGLDPVVVSTR